MSDSKITLYSFPLSGHAHRVELALALMGLAYETVFVDLAAGEQNEDWFRELSPLGLVPVIKDVDGTVVYESTAILAYLGAKYDDGTWYPKSAKALADVQTWFSLAGTRLKEGPANARLITLFGAPYDKEETVKKAYAFLTFLDAQLASKAFLLGNVPSLADVAIYSYTAHAPEGHVSLETYKNVRAWIAAIEGLKGFVAMPKTAPSVPA